MNEDTLINSHIEDEASYEIDLLFFTYFHLFEKDVGVPATSQSCMVLYDMVTNQLDYDNFFDEYKVVSPLLGEQCLPIYYMVLMAPFKDSSFGDGNDEFIWYEKFTLLHIFQFIHNLSLRRLSYYAPAASEHCIPSKKMTLNLDEEFCNCLIQNLQSDRTLFIEIISQMNQEQLNVKIMVKNQIFLNSNFRPYFLSLYSISP